MRFSIAFDPINEDSWREILIESNLKIGTDVLSPFLSQKIDFISNVLTDFRFHYLFSFHCL